MVFGLKLGLPNKKAPAEPPAQSAGPGGEKPPKGSAGGGAGGGKGALTVNEFVARTKRCREKGLEPTKPELIAYARYLGIDPIADHDLMWIADEALNAPLPSEWTEHHDSADRVFYYNVQTHASSWTHPLEQLHRDTYKGIVAFRSGDMSKEEQAAELEKLRLKCEDAEREAHKELQAWTEHVDDQGQKFYYNREFQRSVWTDPRPARCHSLYLQMKALRVLSRHCGLAAPASRNPEALPADLNWPLLSDRDRAGGGAGGQARKADRPQQVATLNNSGAEGAVSLEEDNAELMDKEQRKRKKKRHKEGKDDDYHIDSGGEAELRHTGAGGLPPAALGKPGGLLELKKPPIAAVEEARSALGVSSGTLPPMGRGALPASLMSGGRLGTPPGDGLSSVGRAKVRAGIKLEPLRAGA